MAFTAAAVPWSAHLTARVHRPIPVTSNGGATVAGRPTPQIAAATNVRNRGSSVPTVSIIMPTYNGAAHVRPAIESVLSQDFGDFELIVVDDNSRDDTIAIAASYADPRVRTEQNPANLGPEGNWNRALSLAQGTYIKLLPQDDVLIAGSLGRQVRALEADSGETIALVFGAREVIDGAGRVLMRRGLPNARTGRVAAADLARRCVRKGTNMIGEPGAVLFRRSLAERIGSFDAVQPYVIDLDYWLRLLVHGDAWYMDEVVSAFRVSPGSWSVAIGNNQSRQYSDFLDRMQAAGLVRASKWEMAIGKINARLTNVLRLVFYKVILR